MTPEPQRLQYLDAMGLTAWVGRYQLPNALPTQACDWPEPQAAEAVAPQARLHALIDEAPRPAAAHQAANASHASSAQAGSATPRPAGPSPASSARALLGMAPAEASVATAVATGDESSSTASWGTPPAQATTETVVEAQVTPPADQPPLRFSVQLAALDGRWLVMLPGDEAPHLEGEALLKALWRAAGITPTTDLTFSHFRWPLLANLKASAPLDEAREGLRAFLNGPARRDWQPERVLIFGNREDCATLREVLGITSSSGDAETSSLLDIPVWQGPELATLARSSDAKRQLWPLLIRWGKAWSRGMTEGTSS
ncbi:hypothetical protein QD228_11400 [Cobetia sp. 3AK]|uniref:hypothetical protein n=1 Tax=Cobetia sp. 3AK TaxID=3040020 RepID=UPI00244C4CAA|nr:hypothetical protein [Cobetia sp. 3AK]MDH2374442.1 hypothetical protein [Cobetia sp. 3AK]